MKEGTEIILDKEYAIRRSKYSWDLCKFQEVTDKFVAFNYFTRSFGDALSEYIRIKRDDIKNKTVEKQIVALKKQLKIIRDIEKDIKKAELSLREICDKHFK